MHEQTTNTTQNCQYLIIKDIISPTIMLEAEFSHAPMDSHLVLRSNCSDIEHSLMYPIWHLYSIHKSSYGGTGIDNYIHNIYIINT